VTVPIVCTATYSFDNSAQIHDHFQGRAERWEYGRYGNPTVRVAEQKLAALEGAEDAVLFPSGMNAITTLLLAMLKPGDHVVMTSDCYRRTRQFLRTTLTKFGVRHSVVPPDDLDALAAAIEPQRTRLIITEAPTNPCLRVVDLARVMEIKRRFPGVKLLVDTTLATPVLCRPLLRGADLVTHSCTKYLAGHNDVLSGVVCGAQPLMDGLRDARGVFGGMPDPHGAYLLVRGLKTLAVRMRQHNESALRIARFLESHPGVERVFYPGLPSHPDHAHAAAPRADELLRAVARGARRDRDRREPDPTFGWTGRHRGHHRRPGAGAREREVGPLSSCIPSTRASFARSSSPAPARARGGRARSAPCRRSPRRP
jgi:cystathionine gamma-synthase